MRIYRIQDKQGRGPFKPGFSDKWLEDRDDWDALKPWYDEMGPVHRLGIAGMSMGIGCRSLDQLRRWFSAGEYLTLLRHGYQAVGMNAGRILGES